MFVAKNLLKNLSKTTSEPFKNRCQKCVVFQHRFFRVSASIFEGLGPPRWSQVGFKSQFPQYSTRFLAILNSTWLEMSSWSAPDSILEPPGLDFGGSGPRFWPILKSSGIDFSAEGWQESVSYQQVRISWFRLKFMKVFHLACQQHEDKL